MRTVGPYSEMCQFMWLKHKVQLRVVGSVEKSIGDQMEAPLIIGRMVINSTPKDWLRRKF